MLPCINKGAYMIKEFCHDKPKNEKCLNCNADLIDCTTYGEFMRGEKRFIKGRDGGYCARDDHQFTIDTDTITMDE